jgi:NAD(P)-dependent dehydrogenase (short-subunit alcohol dehydrogenase family)
MAEKSEDSRRSVLITGCSTGIGHCVAKGLQARGYRVFASARKGQDVARLAEEGFEALQLDLDNGQSIEHAVELLLERSGGRLYGLFNNGGFGQPGAVEDIPTEALRAQFETLVFGWHHLTRLVIPVMRAQGEGRIIQNSSVLGFAVMPYRGAYSGAKFAIEGLSDAMRLELKGSGVWISLVEPGPILSRFRANAAAKFIANVAQEGSAHQRQYQAALGRLEKEGPAIPFTLPPEAVLKRVIHALESRHPRPRYFVTLPTYLFWYLKRLLPVRLLDQVLLKASGDGAR